MSSATAKALLQSKQSRCLEKRKDSLNLQSVRGDKDIITDSAFPMSDNHLFNLIQGLDTQWHAHITSKEYDAALKTAMEIQQCAPESYFGYQRVAQTHLIRNDCDKALHAYQLAFEKVRDDITLLRKSVENAQHIFDQAAVELANANQFDKADRIANGMISLLPTSPTGYLRAGELYEMKNKTKEAMDSYDQGISSVPVNHHALLIQHKIRLQKRIDRKPHYDFIEHVPLEITSKVAQYLTVRDLIECLKVSKSWKQRIDQCPEAWRVLHVEYNGGNIDVNAIQNVKRFVRQVVMKSASGNPSLVTDLLASIGNGEFESLTCLILDRGTMDAQFIPHLIKIFDRVRLTHLDLIFSFNKTDSHIPLDQVLRSCSHLQRLRYHMDSLATKVDHERLPKEPTKITHLSIGGYPYYEGKVETPHFFIPLIPIFPHLVDLCITDSSPGDLQTITKQCTNLRRLVIMQRPKMAFLEFPDSKRKGLQYLNIDGYIDPNDVAGVIAQNSKTLLSIDVTLGYETDWDGQLVDPHWDWGHITKLNCPLLKKLHFFIDYYWPFEQWIGDCPALEDIRLEGVAEMTDSIFDALERLPKLRSLDLEDCQKLTNAGLSGFFDNLRKQGSQLHTVALRFCDSLSTESLLSLMSLPSLRSLCIHSSKGVTETVLHDFAANVNCNSAVESVSFRWLDGVTDQPLLKLIRALPHLQSLNLSYLNNITDNSVNAIADLSSGTSLSKLNVYCCNQITPGVITSARELLDITQDYIE
ncbi:hypothetical protein BJV82DRAFT_665228 [Fennellomyces sp. T-0311]|nr:hypothetical protein BJV82DRAFT_665228 [Fennellomyces sp. T-0311]